MVRGKKDSRTPFATRDRMPELNDVDGGVAVDEGTNGHNPDLLAPPKGKKTDAPTSPAITLAKNEVAVMAVPALDQMRITGTLLGITPAFLQKFSEKAMREIALKHFQEAKVGRTKKNPVQSAVGGLYVPPGEECLVHRLSDGKVVEDVPTFDEFLQNRYVCRMANGSPFLFPSAGLKRAMVEAGAVTGEYAMTDLRKWFTVKGIFCPMYGVPYVRCDMVRVRMQADLRFRACFPRGWKMKFEIVFFPNAISPQQVLQLLGLAGRGVGIGEWRPQKNGPYGTFRIFHDPKDPQHPDNPRISWAPSDEISTDEGPDFLEAFDDYSDAELKSIRKIFDKK